MMEVLLSWFFPRTRPWFQKDRTQYEKTLDGSGPISGVLAQFHEDEHRGNHGHEQGPQENATQIPDATTAVRKPVQAKTRHWVRAMGRPAKRAALGWLPMA